MRSLAIKSISKLKTKGIKFRNRVILDYSELSKVLPSKSLSLSLKNKAGRNETGRVTTRHRGGRSKRQLKCIDYSGYVSKYSPRVSYISSEYDSNRSVVISRVLSGTFDFGYRLSSEGQKLQTYKSSDFEGNILPLSKIRVGTSIYNIDGKYCRSAGTSGRLLLTEGEKSLVRLSSKRTKWLSSSALASIGESSNEVHKLIKKGKAGANRWLGWRPTVRGNAQNAVDHPNGGKTRGGQSKTKWGKQAKWSKKS